MSEYFKGVTFANQHLSPADDAVIRRRLIADGVLTGCEISHSRDTLSMAPGYLMACGRQIQHPSAEGWKVTYSPATSKTASGTVIALSDASSGQLQGLRIYGRTTQDGTPTPDNPVPLVSVGDGGSISMHVSGLQMLYPTLSLLNGPVSSSGITATLGSDGNIVLNGTSTGNVWIPVGAFTVIEGKTYTVYSALGVSISIWSESQDYYKNRNTEYFKFTSTKTERKVIVVNEVANLSVSSFNLNAAAFYGDVENLWEPYTGQTLPISTPNGLPGVQVTSGGNYTDDSGQQWLCDEVDLARGVYVQRLAHYIFDGSPDERWSSDPHYNRFYDITVAKGINQYDTAMLCNYSVRTTWSESTETHYCFINEYDKFTIGGSDVSALCPNLATFKAHLAEYPIVLIYVLETPIETPIPSDELAAYAALHTNAPNTTVYNDAGAYMEVGYYPQDDTIPTNGYARILLTVDLTRTAAADKFDQVNTSIEYATSKDGFPALVQDDINNAGSVYQLPLAVVSIGDGTITGITDSIGNAEPI